MKKVIALMFCMLLFFIIGCSSGIQQQQPIANNNVQPQKQINVPERPKNDEDEKRLEKARIKPLKYKQSQARSKQKTIAVFTIGENDYRVGDTSFKMDGPAIIRNNLYNSDTIFVPLQAFNRIVSMPDSGIKWTEYEKEPYNILVIRLKREIFLLLRMDKVVQLYGMGYNFGGHIYEYRCPTIRYSTLRFMVEDNKVTKIMVGQGPPVEP